MVFGLFRRLRECRTLTSRPKEYKPEFQWNRAPQVKQLNDFNRKVAMEKELEKTELLKYNNIAFDKSGNFIAFAGLAGIKVVNIVTDKVVRVLGRPENLRFLQVLDLFQRSC